MEIQNERGKNTPFFPQCGEQIPTFVNVDFLSYQFNAILSEEDKKHVYFANCKLLLL